MGSIISKLSRLSLGDVRMETEKKIDKCNYPEENNLKTPKEKFIADQILDPRSATLGIRRTPLVLVKVCDDTPIRPRTYLETDLDENSTCDNSFVRSETDGNDATEQSLILEESLEVYSHDLVEESCLEEANNLNAINDDGPMKDKVKKTFIYEDIHMTPESTPVKPKGGRTPLGVVSTNNSPLPSPLGKPWRGIREERLRLGLENTPPPVQDPFPDVVQSAPGKVGIKRTSKKSWGRAHWALDESIVI